MCPGGPHGEQIFKPADSEDESCMFGTDEVETTASHLICLRFLVSEEDAVYNFTAQRVECLFSFDFYIYI